MDRLQTKPEQSVNSPVMEQPFDRESCLPQFPGAQPVSREVAIVTVATWVQCIMDGPLPRFTEINARLGGGLPLGIAAGVNSPLWLLARIAGIEVEIPPLGSYQRGLYLSRFDDSLFVTEAEREATASHRL